MAGHIMPAGQPSESRKFRTFFRLLVQSKAARRTESPPYQPWARQPSGTLHAFQPQPSGTLHAFQPHQASSGHFGRALARWRRRLPADRSCGGAPSAGFRFTSAVQAIRFPLPRLNIGRLASPGPSLPLGPRFRSMVSTCRLLWSRKNAYVFGVSLSSNIAQRFSEAIVAVFRQRFDAEESILFGHILDPSRGFA